MRVLLVGAAVFALASAGSAASRATIDAELRIEYWAKGTGEPGLKRAWKLRCSPTGGSLPGPAAACRALASLEEPFAPVPRGALCGASYHGADVALVRGNFRGRRVWTRFKRDNLCEATRWDRVGFLFPARRTAERTVLTITVWPKGKGTGRPSKRWTLSCDPAGGTLPRRGRSCTSLASLANPFAPVPGDVACTEIYGGPAQALVTGRHAGRRVWARFHRSDGCHIDRWNRHRFLFPVSV
jgi:hypothetical protein